jgi:hypothetical protein
MYNTLNRYLQSRIGKDWGETYSVICNSSPNRLWDVQIRQAVRFYVDHNGPSVLRGGDYFVEDGILRQYNKVSHKSRFKKEIENAPITVVTFGDKDIWFEIVSTPDGPAKSKHTRHRPIWFEFTRTRGKKTVPVFDYSNGYDSPKQTGVQVVNTEEVTKKQCNHKQVQMLNAIARRESKIDKLTYASKNGKIRLTAEIK